MKLYVGWHESDWLSVLAPESRLSWILFLERVKTHGDDGSLKKSNYEDLARRWNVGVENIRTMVKAGVMDGAIDEDETHWHVTGWDEYQEDRANADRQKRYRERLKQAGRQPDQERLSQAESSENACDLGSDNVTLQTTRNVTGRGEERRREEIPPLPPKGGAGRPSLDEWVAYAKSIDFPSAPAEEAWNHYEMVGWKYGKSHHDIKEWKRACVTSKTFWKNRGGKNGSAARRTFEDVRVV